MSEVLNAEVTSSEEGGLSRRRIVKGAAWSVPVIAAAIAAPAASASGNTATLELVGAGAITLFRSGSTGAGNGNQRQGTGPASFRITNTGSSGLNGVINGTISIVPRAGALVGVGVQAMPQAPFTASGFLSTKAFEATFTSPNTTGIQVGAPLDVPIRFNYQTSNTAQTATYDVYWNITQPVVASATATVTVTF